MFPFQQDDELSDFKLEDLILLENNNNNVNNFQGQRSSSSNNNNSNNNNNNNNDSDKKKIVHREIERQRRQEMSALYASIRNILPAHYIKGKRSISDHVGEAAKYIKEMERNVKELGEKRDELRKSSSSSSSSSFSSSSNKYSAVNIGEIGGGCLEIEINVEIQDKGFSLSNALHIAFEEGLCVQTYSSTKIDSTRFLHNLLCQVSSERRCIDMNRLQKRLIDLLSH